MYVKIKLLKGFEKTLTYKIPEKFKNINLLNKIIKVPIRKSLENGLVVEQFKTLEKKVTYSIREIIDLESFPNDAHYNKFIKKISSYYILEPITFYRRIRNFFRLKKISMKELCHSDKKHEETNNRPVLLTDEQKESVNYLKNKINENVYCTTLIHGVTSSGKTEIYKKIIEHAFARGKSSILMLPEVSLAVEFTNILRNEILKNIKIYGFHSAVSNKEKGDLWQELLAGNPLLIIGVHLPTTLPISNLGLIIIDEEHDQGFQEKKHPKINSKEVALIRAKEYGFPIVLGSATPSLQSIHNTQTKDWKYLSLKNRFQGAFPKTVVVKIRKIERRKNFWITPELEKAIKDRLLKNEQTMIFINRRGESFFIKCSECGFVFRCVDCSVSLTVHSDNMIKCHYCAYQIEKPKKCSNCSNKKDLIQKGIGTQRAARILEKLFPRATVARMDFDTTTNKRKSQETINKFKNNEIDILVGTQTITKGYHFPSMTLVGILWADIDLSIPFFNAAEITLQRILQVAGRAGRESKESLVIVQTMLDHPIFSYLNEKDYKKFCDYELKYRKELNYPPYKRFVEIEIRNQDEKCLEIEAKIIADKLRLIGKENIIVLGPAPPPVHKIKKMFSRKIYLKSSSYREIIAAYKIIMKSKFESSIFLTPNPQQ